MTLFASITAAAGEASRAAAGVLSTLVEQNQRIRDENAALQQLAAERQELLDTVLAPADFENVIDRLHNQGREFERRAQEIGKALRAEVLDLDSILELLASVQDRFSQRLQAILQLVDQGTISAQEAVREVEGLRRQLGPDVLSGQLAQGVENYLRDQIRQGRRNGRL